jgi:hypothetical protein
MNARSRRRHTGLAVLAVPLIVLSSALGVLAQGQIQIDGTVQWLSGNTLTVLTDTPGPTAYVIIGQFLQPVPGARPVVSVDLSQLPQSEYAFMRPGERLTVFGTLTGDGRRVIATSLVRGAGAQTP